MEQAPKQAPKPAAAKPKGKKKDEVQELSAEDKELKEQLDLLVTRTADVDANIQRAALDMIQEQIRTSTSSMTSVPKPLKFLAPHYATLTTTYDSKTHPQNKEKFADVLSFLSMTMDKTNSRACLRFKLAGSVEALTAWGHEFVRFLCAELGEEYHDRKEKTLPVDDLMMLVSHIVPFHMKHNAEPEACDLLMEVDALAQLIQFVDITNYERVALYLTQCANYVPAEERSSILAVILDIYQKLDKKADALRIALKLDDRILIHRIWSSAEDGSVKKQLAFLLARHHFLPDDIADAGDLYSSLVRNTTLSEKFIELARNLDIMEPKDPEDIYKSHLTEGRTSGVDSARGNLASTFVNAFVNAGFGKDNLMSGEGGNTWIFKNKDHGKMSAAASLGLILLWDVDEGLAQIDKYLYSQEDTIKAGALIGVGLVNANVRNEVEPAWALLSEHITSSSGLMQAGALMGLALAYAGSNYEELREAVQPLVKDPKYSMDIVGLAALCLGLSFVGSGHPQISEDLISTLLARDEASLANTNFRFLCLGLGLLYLGRGEEVTGIVERLSPVKGNAAKYAQLTLQTCAFAGTGNVLQIQKLLHECAEHLTENAAHQSVAAFGIALVALGEDLGAEMASRTFDHLLQYGELSIRRAVPLGLAALHVSNPDVPTTDTLSKLSHDHDPEVAQAAILALGVIGAGTNNSRIGGLLRNLSTYYYKDANHLFVVRLAQGLLHMGKGTMTLNPVHSGGLVLNKIALGALISILHCCLDFKNIFLSSKHYLFYLLTLAMQPRMLMTFDEELKPLEVSVRVGQAVDTVGQAGKPKTITGFQTHTTPVLIAHGERAELATEDYEALSPNGALEGFVILRKIQQPQ